MTRFAQLLATSAALAMADPVTAQSPLEAAHQAHDTYLAAINANDLGLFLDAVTDDIVLIAPNSAAMEGKAEVAPWVGGYFEAVRTAWQKTPVEFVVSGDWAFERYMFTVADTPHGGGDTFVEHGNGINIYRREDDGVWRVARDAWATSGPRRTVALACSHGGLAVGPC